MPAQSPNAARGEVAIGLDDSTFVMRPTLAAIQAIEQRTGQGLFAIWARLRDNALTTQEIAIVAHEGMRAVDSTIAYERVSAMIYAARPYSGPVMTAVAHFILHALNGGRAPADADAGEAKAARTTG